MFTVDGCRMFRINDAVLAGFSARKGKVSAARERIRAASEDHFFASF